MPYHVVKRGSKFVVEKKDGSKSFGSHDTKAEADDQMAAMYAHEPKAAMRHLHLRGALGAVRTELWDGREHLVVPVVALQEAVIHAVNAKTAEYVPVQALTDSASKWNGHPLVVGHPVRAGKQISAHSSEVLERHGFGFIRQASMTGARLGMEAMVDPARLTALKQDQLLADLRAGKPIEVSVGAFVNANDKVGTFGGRNYSGEWTEITPDHLAFLPGGIGACSLAMGCGAHRAAMLVTAEGFVALRDIPQSERDKMDASDFAGPDQSFPIKTQADVDAASHLVGKAADPAAVKKRVITIAKRKGLKIPEAWQVKGASMNVSKLKRRILALFDTPEQAASEEVAELVAYNSMRTLFDGVGDQWDAASALIDELIADEEENPTETPAQEDAEEEVEDARLDAIRMHCYSMMAALQSVINACTEQQMEDVTPTDPRYMERFKTLIGKSISAKNMKTIQQAHDASHDMHSHTVSLGAECNGMRLLEDRMLGGPGSGPHLSGSYAAHEHAAKLHEKAAAAHLNAKSGGTQLRQEALYASTRADRATQQAVGDKVSYNAFVVKSASHSDQALDHASVNHHEKAAAFHSSAQRAHEMVMKQGSSHRTLASKNCPTCDGIGQVKTDGKQSDCPTCSGSGEVRAAAQDSTLKAACSCEEAEMDRKTRIAALLGQEPIKAWATDKALEALDDKALEALEAQTKKQADELKAAQAATATLKAASEHMPTEEEYLKAAPESIRTLVADKKQQDANEKAKIVAKLVPMKTLSQEQLEAKSLDELRTLATFAKVETPIVDFSGRGVAVPRGAQAEDYTPPNPYEAGIKALQGKAVN